MGGGQTLQIGLTHVNQFRWLGVFSMGLMRPDSSAPIAEVMKNPEAVNKKLRLFWIACGKEDGLYESAVKLDAYLKENRIQHIFRPSDGAHTWRVWRGYLSEFAPMLFR